MKQPKRRTGVLIGSIGLAAMIGLGAGAAVATGAVVYVPVGGKTDEGIDSRPMPDPVYPENKSGQTYGSAAEANSPENEPDLILVDYQGADGVAQGYVFKKDLDIASGVPSAVGISSPEEALEWSKRAQANGDIQIPVYDETGTKELGTFTVHATKGFISGDR
jgi:hypothetical protein